MMTKMLLLLFRFVRGSLLSLRVFTFVLIKFRGAPKIDLPLSKFSLAKAVLTLVFSVSKLILGGTKQ